MLNRLGYARAIAPTSWGSARSALRRTLLTVVGLQLALAVVLTLVDSYRRRGKRPRPFETTDPTDVRIGEGEVTSYTFGEHLYEDMLTRHRGRPAPGPARVLHLEGRRGR